MNSSKVDSGRPLCATTPEMRMGKVSSRRAPLDHIEPKKAAVESLQSTQEAVTTILRAWRDLPESSKVELKDMLKHPDSISAPAMHATETSFNPFRSTNGYTSQAEPLARAPDNVLVFRGPHREVLGWRNVFDLPIQYDVELCPNMLSANSTVLSTHFLPKDGPKRRFIVIDEAVHKLYGPKMVANIRQHGVEPHFVVLPGEEANKRMEAVDKILEELCIFGLRRREPVLAVGGGVLLDIVGMAASLYRRGVPFIRVPTTLLALVDASVGVKNGVDYCSCSMGPQKNRVGTFYAPIGAFLDKSFIASQDERNVVNGLGEIMKLALVRSLELFELLEVHGSRLVREQFQGSDGVADRVIQLSVQIMLEELGPNLWEHRLERCVDYGHTFSKIIEMVPNADIMHGEAVNVDGFLSLVIAERRKLISVETRDRVFRVMKSIGLPTIHPGVKPQEMNKALQDAVEHRHGKQRVPLVSGGIGNSVCVNDITPEELEGAIDQAWALHGVRL